MTKRIAEIAARCEKPLTGRNKYHGHIATKSSKHGEGVYDTIIERLYQYEYEDIPYLLSQLAERDEELLNLQKEVASLAIESIEREKTLARLEVEVMAMREAQRCNDCPHKRTVGCQCARAAWRDPLPAAPEEGEQNG